MALNLEFAKKHWHLLAGGLVAVLVLYYILKRGAAAASGGTGSTSLSTGGGGQVQALSAAASLQNAQVNAQVEMEAYAAGVQNNQIEAALAASLAQTKAQLEATNRQTDASVAIAQISGNTAVSTQQILSTADVAKTQIEGSTIVDVAHTNAAAAVAVNQAKANVELAQIVDVNSQIGSLMRYSKHFSQDIKAIAPVLAIETGQGTAGAQIAGSNAQENIAKSPANTIAAASSGIGTLLTGLFA